jgi:hypothetical protein
MVTGAPLSVTLCPSTFGSPLKRRCLPRHVLVGAETSSESGCDLQELEEVPRDDRPLDTLRAAVRLQSGAGRIEGNDVLEDCVLLAPIEEARRRNREPAELLHNLVDPDQRFWMRIWKRPQQHAVDDTEDGAARADAKRQREDRDRRKAGGSNELTNRIAHVSKHVRLHQSIEE